MADAVFTRLPLGDDADHDAVRGLLGARPSDKPLCSLIPPAEVALFITGSDIVGLDAAPPEAARYWLEQASDTGPAAEPFGALMLVAFDVPADRADEVERWYNEEHIGLLMRADGWLRARRYRVLRQEGGPRWTSMAFHELRDQSVMDSPERAFARSTPWRAELEREAWFGKAGRGLFAPAD